MELLTKNDLYSKQAYETLRADFRRRVMVQKDRRRVLVGEHCSIHFECRDTVLYQVLEMIRVEQNWERAEAIEAELEAYNPIIPQSGELSATLMLEYAEEAERHDALQRLVGMEQHVWLQIGATSPVPAQFDVAQLDADKVSSVQYIKWHLSDAQRQLLQQDGTVVRIVIDHPHYHAQAVLAEDTRRAIMHDPD
jgi:hypothetical protein